MNKSELLTQFLHFLGFTISFATPKGGTSLANMNCQMPVIKWTKLCLFAMCLTLLPRPSFAIPDRNYEQRFKTEVLPFFLGGRFGSFDSASGKGSVSYGLFPTVGAKEVVVIVPGSKQSTAEYAEEIFDWHTLGYSVAIFAHIGQGESSRLAANSQVQHIGDFRDFVEDLSLFMKKFANPVDPATGKTVFEKVFIHGHSMGAAVAAIYLAQEQKAEIRAAFTSPMFEINLRGVPLPIVRLLILKALVTGQFRNYVRGDRDGGWAKRFQVSEKSTLSTARLGAVRELIEKEPSLITSGVSYGFLNASIKASKKIADLAKIIKSPVLILTAGEDRVVLPGAQVHFQKEAASCSLVVMPGASHDFMFSRDELRDRALSQMNQFFRNN